MCGRYTITNPGDVLDDTLESLDGFEPTRASEPASAVQRPLTEELLQPRFNAAPTQILPMIRVERGRPAVAAGSWSFTGSGRRPLINARSETVAEKPSFKDAFRRRRCLVPADGFYEWRPRGNRQPFFFHRPAGKGFCFAGLWQPSPGDAPEFCIVTGPAGPWMAEVHHRRPLILERSAHQAWLDPGAEPKQLLASVIQHDPSLERHPVDFAVNRIANDEAGLIEPVREAPQNLSLFD